MANESSRAVFLEHIRETPLTIDEIVDQFNVSKQTARNWSKYDEVEKIPGSYPHMFRRKETGILPQAARPMVRKVEQSITLPNVPEDQIKAFFDKVMMDEAPAFNFNEEFRQVDGAKTLNSVEAKLKSALVLTRYYRALMEKDGLL